MSVRGPLGATPQSAGFEFSPRALDARGVARSSSRALLGIAGLLISGLLITVSAAQTQVLLPETIRPAPTALAGAFASTGLNLHAGGAAAVLVAMFISYAVVVAAASQLSGRLVLVCVGALYAIVLLAPPLISTDIFSYQAYARMGSTYGTNPYLSGPYAIGLDPLYSYIGAKWINIPSVYGPLFTGLSYLLAPLSIAASVIAYKLIAVLASLGIVTVVWNCSRLRGVDPVRAVALVGLNPLLIVYGIGGGHNDLLMLLALMAGMYAILAGRERLGGGLTALAIGIKLTAGLMLPFAIAARGPRRGHTRRHDLLTGSGLVMALIAALSFALYGTGALSLFDTVRKSQSEGDWHSISGFISTRLGLVTVGHLVGYLLIAAFVGISAWLLRRVWRGQSDWIDAAGWSTVAMLIAANSLLPWYVAWLLPLAALGTSRGLVRVSVALTGVVLVVSVLGYIPSSSLPAL